MSGSARTALHASLRALSRPTRPSVVRAGRASRTATSTSLPTARALSTSVPSRALDSSSPSPSSSSSPTSPPDPAPRSPGTHLFSPTPSSQHTFLTSLLSPLPLTNSKLVDQELASKVLTHKSGVDKRRVYGRSAAAGGEGEGEGQGRGKTGHNEKLAFIGRRVLRLHLTTHLLTSLSTSPALLSSTLSDATLAKLLDTKTLGASVGKAWRLEEGLKWREVRGKDGEMTGLWKCRGAAVEAVVGGVYTTQGIATSQALFERLILPNLDLPRTLSQALLSPSSGPSVTSSMLDGAASAVGGEEAVRA
ncbi:hypothetical protein JCM11641_008161 [Rhodosporidiobolus odoratus]